MKYTYPFKSDTFATVQEYIAGQDYILWHDTGQSISNRVAAIDKPIIEIGGPTDLGFYFLEGVELPSKPIISNISHNPLPHHPNASKLAEMVDKHFDATSMPFENASVGIFLMSAMSISSDWWVELPDNEHAKQRDKIRTEFIHAKFEMSQIAAGIMRPDIATYAQRVKIYLEVHRCLEMGGLFFTDGNIDEIAILRQLGFELIACLIIDETEYMSYEIVAQKSR